VQRDLLPLIEGSTVSTKHGPVATDHVLFIASGAFTSAKPSDMMAELQVGLRGSGCMLSVCKCLQVKLRRHPSLQNRVFVGMCKAQRHDG
jgi:hypothetical protein